MQGIKDRQVLAKFKQYVAASRLRHKAIRRLIRENRLYWMSNLPRSATPEVGG